MCRAEPTGTEPDGIGFSDEKHLILFHLIVLGPDVVHF